MSDTISIEDIILGPRDYPEAKWTASTIDSCSGGIISGDAFECLWAITKYGTIRSAAKNLNSSVHRLYEQIPNSNFVYFIQSLDMIKVGVSHGRKYTNRVDAFHVANPHGLSLVAAILGDKNLETEFHLVFAKWRVKGEWFHALPVLLYLNNEAYELGASEHDSN